MTHSFNGEQINSFEVLIRKQVYVDVWIILVNPFMKEWLKFELFHAATIGREH